MNHHPIEVNGSRSGRVQTSQDMHQCGFAAAGWPNNGDKFTRIYIQRYSIQSTNGFATQMIGFVNVPEFQKGHEKSSNLVSALKY
jgi:hypothetical protein